MYKTKSTQDLQRLLNNLKSQYNLLTNEEKARMERIKDELAVRAAGILALDKVYVIC